MENVMRTAETKIDQAANAVNGHGKKIADSAVNSSENILNMATDIAGKVRDFSGDAVKESVSFAKKYPIHTALGAAAIGFFAGFLVKRS